MTGVTVPLALLAGVISFASPCFLPIVPVYIGYLLGDASAGARHDRRTALRQACAFVAGFSVVFVTLWASIGVIGDAVGEHRATLRMLGGAVLIVLGLHVAGLIEIPLLQRTIRPTVGGQGQAVGVRRSALLGVAFGAGWTPCIGPILGGVIGLASTRDTVAEGALLLVAYCLGLGVPFVAVAVGADVVRSRLGVLRRHGAAVALGSGAVLIAGGFLMITDLFARVSGLFPPIGL
ncbi:Protein DipZ [Austwickia sp. TVS 96-490-7B]|uniref:cytochrome c biogenesis CcdA family protein n=1 Tax=Austwickia sp. TVS 96-490-7B TaxID=2830843 RepID=UPI001C585982|nr:cytochrome c biogenesis protein CcdA [Austwickia sp. TVS 96-490-7B]MBW3084822.1 Protein DipZ [Austwickia sp. TVS 96-490-7B]